MNKNYKKEYLKKKLKADKEDRNKLSLEELDKSKDLKRAYNEGIKACIESITKNVDHYLNSNHRCGWCGASKKQFKKLLLK